MIVSNSNSKIKLIRSLFAKKQRYKKEKYLVEGLQISLDYLKFSNYIDFALISEEFEHIDRLYELKNDLEIYSLKKEIFDKISDTKNNQGIILVVNFENYSIDEILNKNTLVLIDGLQDPGNLGTIIRTCDAFNIDGIITMENTVDLYNSKTVRASMGSIARIPIVNINNSINTINFLKEKQFKILATTPRFTTDVIDINKKNKNAIIIGNESTGVSENILKICDDLIGIKMKGDVESLNAAVAAGIIIYKLSE